MSEEKDIPRFEMVMKLPYFITQPIELEDGTVLAIGDQVEHVDFGRGTITRIGAYDEEPKGPFIFVDFGNDVRKELDPSFTHIIKKNKMTESEKENHHARCLNFLRKPHY